MKSETLKKIIDLAAGFEYKFMKTYSKSIPHIQYSNISLFDIGNVEQWDQYPLLLRRAVEGWNIECKTTDDLIYIYEENLCSDKCYYFRSYPSTEYLTPQEQATEACLIELLEK